MHGANPSGDWYAPPTDGRPAESAYDGGVIEVPKRADPVLGGTYGVSEN